MTLIVDDIGNPYSASSLLGLAAVLDIAKPNKKVFVVSYGSGAGADSFILKTTPLLEKTRNKALSYHNLLKSKEYISYTKYLKFERKI